VIEVAVDNDQLESAVQLAGAAAALRDALGIPLWPTERARLDPVLAGARQILAGAAADAAWTRGLIMPADLSVAMALDLLRQPAVAQPNGLTFA
jgi:hypothetical protein